MIPPWDWRRARQTHLAALVTWSKAKLRQKAQKHINTQSQRLWAVIKLRSQAQTHDGASWCVAMATAEQGGEGRSCGGGGSGHKVLTWWQGQNTHTHNNDVSSDAVAKTEDNLALRFHCCFTTDTHAAEGCVLAVGCCFFTKEVTYRVLHHVY